eukprot:scaffold25392_cov117-Cylindrotheca_fusiformis.AAC.1
MENLFSSFIVAQVQQKNGENCVLNNCIDPTTCNRIDNDQPRGQRSRVIRLKYFSFFSSDSIFGMIKWTFLLVEKEIPSIQDVPRILLLLLIIITAGASSDFAYPEKLRIWAKMKRGKDRTLKILV